MLYFLHYSVDNYVTDYILLHNIHVYIVSIIDYLTTDGRLYVKV